MKTTLIQFLRVAVLLTIGLHLSLCAQGDRIEAEKNDVFPQLPLKQAIGEQAYKDAMASGNYTYVGNSKCRLCHREFFLGRKKDLHDFAMDALHESGYAENPRCLTCHATGFGVPTGFVSMKTTPRLSNVQCEGCHGPGNVHMDYKKKRIKESGFLVSANEPEKLRKMCKSCHTERWNRSYSDFDTAYAKYKNADPNKASE